MYYINDRIDPCTDGILNYEETDIDCGGSLCPSCQLGDVRSLNTNLVLKISLIWL